MTIILVVPFTLQYLSVTHNVILLLEDRRRCFMARRYAVSACPSSERCSRSTIQSDAHCAHSNYACTCPRSKDPPLILLHNATLASTSSMRCVENLRRSCLSKLRPQEGGNWGSRRRTPEQTILILPPFLRPKLRTRWSVGHCIMRHS